MAMQHATVSAPVRRRKSALHRTTAGDIVIAAIVTLLTLIFVVTNLIVDLLYAALDPRIRYA